MDFRPKFFKSLLGVGLAALLLVGAMPTLPSFAAQLHQFQGSRSNSGGFNLDQNACPPGMVHRRGTAECYDPQADDNRNNFRSDNNAHRPGSSAFGLQFDTGDY